MSGHQQPPQAGDAPERRFFADPDIDRLLHMLLALAGEVATLRARLDTHERLNAASGGWGPGEVEAWQPQAEEIRLRERLHAELLSRVLEPLEALAARSGRGSEHA